MTNSSKSIRQSNLYSGLVQHNRFESRESEYIRWYPKSLTPHFDTASLRPNPNGIYIHVPFCDRLCRFCPFNKQVTKAHDVALYVEALTCEIDIYASLSLNSSIEFIYFGGGTPSALGVSSLSRILEHIRTRFRVSSDAEVTLEAHPSHLDRAFAKSIRGLGVTRVSSGVQSFDDGNLERLGATHRTAESLKAIEAVGAVLGGVSIDLLFRSPGQSLGDWERDLSAALSMPEVDHLSLYSLILKDSTTQPAAESEAAMTVLAHELIAPTGMLHYASCASGGFDFARPSHECVYEVRHWGAPQAEFLGLGPGALGFVGSSTSVNGLGLKEYFSALQARRLPLVSLTPAFGDEAMRRYFVLGVKTLKVGLAEFRAKFAVDPLTYFESEISRLADDGFAVVENDNLVLTPLGRLFVDSVSTTFFSKGEALVPHPEEPEIRRAEIESRRVRARM
ncbi:coproporphyrinogen-III oxidase family protein [Acidovorax facilis]|uniref:coproporphyrinogen-III oxidase family protein n=1 Tax=Acidovorax facilis TaxID=12917 RepID=UPI003D655E31